MTEIGSQRVDFKDDLTLFSHVVFLKRNSHFKINFVSDLEEVIP